VSAEKPDVVDDVSVDPRTGFVVLTVSDNLPWDADQHVRALLDKVNICRRFIDSGRLVAQFPQAKQRSPEIAVMLRYPPDAPGKAFLERALLSLADEGIGFRYQVVDAQP
jgi:hypothetical protein